MKWRIPEQFNIGVDVLSTHSENPDKIALYENKKERKSEYSFKELEYRSNQLANALTELNIEPGDRVAVVAQQEVETALIHLAVYKVGGIVVPLSVLYGPEALRFRLEDCRAKVVFATPNAFEQVSKAVSSIDPVKRVIGIGDTPQNGSDIDYYQFADLGGKKSFNPEPTAPTDPALVMYTSGTTGKPKGVVTPHQFLIVELPGYQMLYEPFWNREPTRVYSPADWAWSGGLFNCLFTSWHYGFSVVASNTEGGFDAKHTFDLIDEYGITNLMLTPTMINLMSDVDSSQYETEQVNAIMVGGEPLPSELHKWVTSVFDCPTNEIYGSTEAAQVTVNCSQWFEAEPGCIGRPVPGRIVDIIDDEGDILPSGEDGKIAIKDPHPEVFLEYWEDPERTEAAFIGDWMLAGDIGYKDENGRFWYRARIGDVIITSGYRVGPSEVEGCLVEHDVVKEAAVIGIDNETRGEIVKAFIILRDSASPNSNTKDEIKDFVRNELAQYQYPREIEFIDELPRTTTGKIQRFKLEEREST
jgi:acetyl-CoA synthetase